MKKETKKELQERIELLDEEISNGDFAYQEQQEAQKEYKKFLWSHGKKKRALVVEKKQRFSVDITDAVLVGWRAR